MTTHALYKQTQRYSKTSEKTLQLREDTRDLHKTLGVEVIQLGELGTLLS